MSLPRLDLRRNPRPLSRFEPFDTEELEFLLAKIDSQESLIALGLSFEILLILRDRTTTTERKSKDGDEADTG